MLSNTYSLLFNRHHTHTTWAWKMILLLSIKTQTEDQHKHKPKQLNKRENLNDGSTPTHYFLIGASATPLGLGK
jgi:hypothetical protein